jgi:drug/metabolite transporter (DMT)-like permease
MKLSFRCPKKVIPRLFLLGGICYCFSPLLQIYAIKNTRALNAGILVATEPVFSTIVAVIFLGERLLKRDYIGYSLILLGVGVLSGLNSSSESLLPGELGFNLLILLGVFFESLSTPTVKSIVPYAHAFILAFYSYLIASAAQFIVGFILGNRIMPPENFSDFLPVIFLGLICTTISYSLWYWVANYLDVHKMCLFIFCQPISAAFFGWLMLGEIPQLKDIIGSLLIFTGIFISINLLKIIRQSKKSPMISH